MPNLNLQSSSFPKAGRKQSYKRKRVNWHEAACCAIQIDLRDYNHLLEFLTEYPLGNGSYRIDLLLIKKLSDQPIPKNFAKIFKTFNLFEIKGLGSSVSTDCYYKTIGYACFLLEQSGSTNQYVNTDISLSFLCLHYPRKLINHLTKNRHLRVEKPAPGVYHIINEIFLTQIIVTRELSPEDSLYLRCLTDNLSDTALTNRLADDFSRHRDNEVYMRYLNQLTAASNKKKGGTAMVCEGLLNLFGTSSEEIREEAAAFYQPKIDELSSQINYLQNLLIQNNIPFNMES